MLLSIGRRIGDDHIDGRLSERPSENAEKDYMIMIILETGQLSFTVLHGNTWYLCSSVLARIESLWDSCDTVQLRAAENRRRRCGIDSPLEPLLTLTSVVQGGGKSI